MAPPVKSHKFELSDGRTIEIVAHGMNRAMADLRILYGKYIKDETVIGLDAPKPRFWIKRGGQFYPISAAAAAVCSHHRELT